MIVNAHDPCLETNLQENIQEITGLSWFCRGGVVLDVGANVGSHAINFARVASQVLAFEPHPHTYWNLCANVLLNQALNVTPLNFALGSRSGSTTVWNIDPTRPNTGMGICVDVGDLVVPIRTIDELQLDRVDFIKIDVEGHELEVLRGAVETLTRLSPIVFAEIHASDLLDPIMELMDQAAYHHFEFVHTQYREKDAEGCTYGYLFWKEGRIQWVDAHSLPA